MNDYQKVKRSFRSSGAWKKFRQKFFETQDHKDPITLSKLPKDANLHHRHVTASADEYQDISNEADFVMLTRTCHKFLHWLYPHWKRDPSILDRIDEEFKKWY